MIDFFLGPALGQEDLARALDDLASLGVVGGRFPRLHPRGGHETVNNLFHGRFAHSGVCFWFDLRPKASNLSRSFGQDDQNIDRTVQFDLDMRQGLG